MHEKLLTILMNKEDITWQTIIMDLVKSEEMNPWDIDVSLLTKRFIEKLNELSQMDFQISGKVVLAAALLLKIKSNRLLGEDMNYLDSLFASSEQSDEEYDDFFSDFGDEFKKNFVGKNKEKHLRLIPRTPHARKRKVSIYDLMEALQKALDVQKRRSVRNIPPNLEIHMPRKTKDIGQVIREVYIKIKDFFHQHSTGGMLTFNQLLPSHEREDKVYTFLPLLHLSTQGKIDLDQKEAFGDIDITLANANS